MDRQAIERRDFPITRRGYEPAAVDSHLRALADEVDALERERTGGGEASLASTAGTQVQSILAAAEAAATDIERQAREAAAKTREDADRDAARTRETAIQQARVHVAAVAQASVVLLERVASMDQETSALIESVRAGAERLSADLAAVEQNMGELYDAASGQRDAPAPTRAVAGDDPAQPSVPVPPSPAPVSSASARAATPPPAPPPAPPPLSPPETAEPDVHPDPEAPQPVTSAPPTGEESADLDGARLIALNMALNGEPRAEADRYLAEHFTLGDREKLINEVYAAIEG